MEFIGVQGTKEDIVSCIDFYQKLSVVGSVSIEDLRKSSIDMYLSDYKSRLDRKKKVSKQTSSDVNYVPNGFYFDSEVVSVDKTYVNHGVIFEDLDKGDITKGVILEDITNIAPVNYVSHGVIFEEVVEDFYEFDYDDDEDDYDSYQEEDVYDDENEVSDDEDFESLFADEDEENFGDELDTDGDDFESLFSDDDEEEFVEVKQVEKEEVKPQTLNNNPRRRFGRRLDVEEVATVPMVEKPKESVPVKAVQEVPMVEKVESYKDVRDFVKRNPGCTVTDVKKFFSQKEIQKALIGAKIVEKRQKLYIV